MVFRLSLEPLAGLAFQYSLCRVVLMVTAAKHEKAGQATLSVLALSSRFDGLDGCLMANYWPITFQYSLCRVVLMVMCHRILSSTTKHLSVLALSSRFDGRKESPATGTRATAFSTRSVESF